jgi:hypothetical protein
MRWRTISYAFSCFRASSITPMRAVAVAAKAAMSRLLAA